MFKLGQRVVIVADSFEQGLPLGEYGYLIARDRNPDSAFAWVVRIPKIDKQFPVVEEDIALESKLLEEEAERVSHEALLDFALATRNEALFRQLVGLQDADETNDEPVKESVEEFIRKVNLKAWI
ncbi:ATPase [Brevibacillus sp. GCM10020057]|uniref:ATPase n=1 Tax=Brevibacillus sp. GCM10020057 TaxID=3317327 RepID=UPI003630B73F